MSRIAITAIALAVVSLTFAPIEVSASDAAPPTDLLLIFDASGSMWGQIEGENKIVIARRVLGEVVDGLDDASRVGVIAYGHRREGDCDDIETVVPMGPLDKTAVKATVDGLNPKGKTPITKSVQTAFASLEGREAGTTVILVSDGLETCGGDPCAAVRTAKASGLPFVMHVVGFDVGGEDVSQLECAAQAGGGMFLSAENAGELSEALDKAIAMPVEIPPGRLSVMAIADGELHDVAVDVASAETGKSVGGGRTYASPDTNPRLIPLPDGTFDVKVTATGMKGEVTRTFQIEIVDGSLVEKELDFSTGELVVGVSRNGELSDAVYHVLVAGTTSEAASGRTYTSAKNNPARIRITSGDYEVSVGSVEITGRPRVSLGRVTVAPGGSVAVSHEFTSGTLEVGAEREGTLVDATLNIISVATGKSVGGGRTYTSASSNPKAFLLEPGEYTVDVNQIRGERRRITVTVVKGETVTEMVDPAG